VFQEVVVLEHEAEGLASEPVFGGFRTPDFPVGLAPVPDIAAIVVRDVQQAEQE
jgi:hypothetical protein